MAFAAFLFGIASGLRTMSAPTIVSWAAHRGAFPLETSRLRFLGNAAVPYIPALLALAELVNDKRAATPSRKIPPQVAARILSGAFAGAAAGLTTKRAWAGIAPGVAGALLGTYGGAAVRQRLAETFGHDAPAALLEDTAAVVLALSAARNI